MNNHQLEVANPVVSSVCKKGPQSGEPSKLCIPGQSWRLVAVKGAEPAAGGIPLQKVMTSSFIIYSIIALRTYLAVGVPGWAEPAAGGSPQMWAGPEQDSLGEKKQLSC